MDEEKLESLLREAKDLIPVDQQLKKHLRKSFEKKSRKKRNSIQLFGLAAAALLFLSFIFTSFQTKTVNAIELLVTDAISFVDLAYGQIHSITQVEGTVYVTMQDQHVYVLNDMSFKKLSENEENNIKSISQDVSLTESNRFTYYEENGVIIKKGLKNNDSLTVDKGHSPAINTTGEYIAYIKEENGIEQVWIADTDLKTKKQLTTNLLQKDSNYPLYRYKTPVWGEGNTLYIIKERLFDNEIIETRLMKIELGTEKLSSKETVEQFMQALMVRGDDYAKSLMVTPPEFLTGSNPRIIGYKIRSVDKLEQFDQVQVEIIQSDMHLPYTSHNQYEFKLTKDKGIYKIEQIKEKINTVISSIDMETLQLSQDGKEQNLFELEQLKKEKEIKSDEVRFSSVFYDNVKDIVYFGIQEMTSNEHASGITLWSYDIQKIDIQFLQRIDDLKGVHDLVLERLLQSPNGKYLALNIFTESENTPFVYLLDLEEQKSFIIENGYAQYWDGDKLMYESSYENITTLQPLEIQSLEPIEK